MQFHFQPLSVDSYDTGLHRFSAFTISVCKLRPASRGSVRLRSADAREDVSIRGGYLTAAEDCATMVRGIRLAERIVGQPALAVEVDSRYRPERDFADSAEVLDFARSTGMTIYHPSGSCRMGSSAVDAVVDHDLRVHNVAGLRVADASIMPTLVSGNTYAASLMIGEKAADLILQARDRLNRLPPSAAMS